MGSRTNPGRSRRRVLISGCGVAGPVLAMFLRRAGMDPVVYEGRAEPDDAAGYFINLAPNGVAVLDALGIKDEVVGRGTPTTSIVLRNHRARTLGTVPEKTVLLKRGALNGTLREPRSTSSGSSCRWFRSSLTRWSRPAVPWTASRASYPPGSCRS